MSTLKATNIKNESSASNNIVLDSGGGVVVSGILTATTFSGDVTGNATGLTGTPNLNVGIVTATSFSGSGSALTGVGKVLQVVQGSTATSVTITTTDASYSSTGLSASITPSSTSSKILILISSEVYMTRTDNGAIGVGFQIKRGATAVYSTGGSNYGHFINGTAYAGDLSYATRVPFVVLDSPSSTSSLTYELYAAKYSGGTVTFQIGPSANTSHIVLIEVAG